VSEALPSPFLHILLGLYFGCDFFLSFAHATQAIDVAFVPKGTYGWNYKTPSKYLAWTKRGSENYFWGGSPLSSLKRNMIPLILGARKVVNNGNH
jgi:hypothetical protein